MKINLRVNSGCTIEAEAADPKAAFEKIAYMQSIFSVSRCGNCECDQLRLMHRKPQGFDYYSVQCQECKYELKFGQAQEGGKLFPKGWEEPYKKDGDGDSKPKAKSKNNSDEYETTNAGGSSDADLW